MKEKIEQIEKQLDELYPIGKGGYILIAYDEDGAFITTRTDATNKSLSELFYNLIQYHRSVGGDFLYMGSMFNAALNYAEIDENVVNNFIEAFVMWLKEVKPESVRMLESDGRIKCNGDA